MWQGSYDGIPRRWLRWFDGQGNWIPTIAEQKQQEQQRAERLAQKLRELGIDPDTDL
jgi:hypothetical protein